MVGIIEGSEESGSKHLGHYLDHFKPRLSHFDVVFILDSLVVTYDALGMTTSLRGNCKFELQADVLTEGVHSQISGVVPDSFRVMRQLLDRLEDPVTGKLCDEF